MSSRAVCLEKLKENLQPDPAYLDSLLVGGQLIDSLDLVELVVSLEMYYDITIDDTPILANPTFDNLVHHVDLALRDSDEQSDNASCNSAAM
jgi:acyl carrier protein